MLHLVGNISKGMYGIHLLYRLRILSAPVTAHCLTIYFMVSFHTQPWRSERGEKGSILT